MTLLSTATAAHLAPARRRAALPPLPVVLSLVFVALVIAWSLVPGLFTGHDPIAGVPADKLLGPSLAHWFGTDHLGRDLFARVVFGSASSVTSALIAVVIGVLAGGLIGLVAGFLGGWVDTVLARFVDVLLAIPKFLLAVIVVTAIGFDTINAAIATGVSAVAVFARVMRSEVIKTREATFVEASFLSGGSRWHILLRHVLPNASRSVLPLGVLHFGDSILVIASLAFLGYGDPPPASDWGLLISIGKDYPKWPWLVYAPALVTIATVLSVNRISRWLRTTD
ncbi:MULTISPECIES: ABC transporter permease [unclassified Rhizobium]|uniref:ABC transporter permease n=1 Tax=Rhizobium sp. PP-CC-3G-465 TaxID=2135648 RepID=UPI000D8EE332|nr:peptide/nickel transport system permease protein [Rhizobium sp. PP-CC-3A-592]PYE29960.1 peptide/nickel transport system permease protein [Rhizobium sp. PP-WC-1G-195]PYE43628.1 peptide/nickel transport system permease protein [Rhizobium sp. PP-F2F-G20b]TCP76375.1 peptide/nickel transport system permease protein [Rhizobium sp. PP-CC-2G-626]TCQ04223.1 peptide/nickel transport system permease protein [Rhizobium sp. PP-F2F-G36]TCQ15301.1 peptide/nickel transport system permease protein [Rhizobiu